MDEIIKFLTFSNVGSLASIIGFAITIFTFVVLWNIKKKFLFNSHVEAHKKFISEKAANITSLLADYDNNSNEIDEILALINVELRAVQRGANGDLKKDVKNSRSMINKYSDKAFWGSQKKFKNEVKAREIKTSLTVITAEFGHVKRELMVGNN